MNTNEQVGSVEPTAAAILPVSEREEPKSGSNSVAILVIEDCEADACLILKHLQANYYVSYCDVIRSQGELEKVLRARHYDLIVCDYVLSDGNAIQALKVAKAACFDGVFIVVSGSVGEEVAVECIKSGAHEFLRKIHMPRLPLVAAQAFYMKEQQRRAAKAERDVRFAEQRFRALVENSADCVDIIDTEGRMVWISPSCYRILGYYPEELIGQSAWDLIDAADIPRSEEKLRRCIETGEPSQAEVRLRKKDGSWIYVEVVATCHTSNPAISGVVCNFRDITERKRTEQALLESERQLRALFDAALDAILIVDDELCVLEANRRACELFAETPLVGRNLKKFCGDEMVGATLCRKLSTERVFRSEITIQTQDGSKRLLEASVTAEFLEGKHLCFFRDITEDREREEQLRHASKLEAIGRLAGGVSHDFNNLLMVITSYSELATTLTENSPKLTGYLEEIQSASRRASELTRQLLAFSRKQVLAPTLLDFNTVLENALKMLKRLIGEDIQLVLDLSRDLRPILADPVQIEQVIVNLAVNARDAMSNGGTLHIQTANLTVAPSGKHMPQGALNRIPPGEYVFIEVRDTGEGIPKDIQTKIFEPFFTTKAGYGTGLGLATVYGIVKQSRGFIRLDSDHGQGTKFRIYFPAAKASVTKTAVTVKKTPHPVAQKILVVEDEEQMLRALSAYLRARGFEVLAAGNAEAALELAKESAHLDLVLTDVVMPGMNGKELASQVSKIHPAISILFMTGYIDSGWVQNHEFKPNEAVLRKPFKLDALVETIARVKSGKREPAPSCPQPS